ncbi:hypothetical protein PHET_11021 [Paragonimus heterotremus]|uniref:Uncharacterized protein n=1 Tax=Paragonimus heterotremus TaxID=100268 RepID=A0A8J4SK17_9TREM|nr:hypothetical protein PHET_11021 [Paragonimus heterotremus]
MSIDEVMKRRQLVRSKSVRIEMGQMFGSYGNESVSNKKSYMEGQTIDLNLDVTKNPFLFSRLEDITEKTTEQLKFYNSVYLPEIRHFTRAYDARKVIKLNGTKSPMENYTIIRKKVLRDGYHLPDEE